ERATPDASPPAISTRPSLRREAVAPARAAAIPLTGLQEPEAGSYSSAELSVLPSTESPPAANTAPSASATQECRERPADMGATAEKLPSPPKTSAVGKTRDAFFPPVISTRPS